jgi:hypothetical protein
MKILLGKIDKIYKKILSRKENIFTDFKVDISNLVDYSSCYKLDEEEWFIIKEFSQKPFFINECNSKHNSGDFNQIDNKDYNKISCLCVFDNNIRYFQRVTPSLYINKRTFLDYSGAPKIVNYNKQITINETPDAVYLSEDDTLLFKDLSKIKTIFPGIEELQREASQPEVDVFLKNDFILLKEISSLNVGVQNRKRIADIGVKFSKLTDEKKTSLVDYARDKTGIEQVDGVFIISSDVQLKNLLYAMDQRYYYSDIYEENRLANSIKIV